MLRQSPITRRPPAPKVPTGARKAAPSRRTVNRIGVLGGQQGSATAGTLATVLVFASQTVLITTLLYYFGWARTQAHFGYFGVDTNLLGFTTADYVLRSINSAFPPLVAFAVVAILLLGFHRRVMVDAVAAPVKTSAGKALTVFVSTAHFLGIAFAVVVLVGLSFPGEIGRPLGFALPLMLVASVGLLGYSGYLRSLRLATPGRRQEGSRTSSHARAQAVLLVAVGLLGVTWWLALYAVQVGERSAMDSAATLANEPDITVYSSDRIALAGPEIVVDEIQQVGNKYRYRYTGLRLLAQAGGKYVLLPVGWQKGRDSVFLIPYNDAIRLDMISR